MSVSVDRHHATSLRLLHAFFLAATIPPFLGAALSDYAYTASYQVQWINFASWLIAGGLVFGGAALICATKSVLGAERHDKNVLIHFLLLLATWALAFVDVLIHAWDAWATMPAGLVLSIVVALLAVAATWLGFSSLRAGARS